MIVGETLGHYRVLEKIGEGGMGVVYRAHDERLDRDVALKVLPAGTLADESARKRFRKEALALSRLNHPSIATVYDFDSQEGSDFLAMEYISGATLAEKLAGGALAEKEVARLGAQLAQGLAEAHEQGVVHRDLKPANLRLTPDGRLKILDFGLARLLGPPRGGDVTRSLSETLAVAGTLPYMSPEQLRGEAAEARSDLYAAGTVLYELATGLRPFREELPSRLADDILHRPPVAPRAINSRVSPELERILLKCLEKEPENRYVSARDLEVDLRRLAAGTEASTPRQAARKPGSRRLAWAAGIGVALLALAAVLVVLDPRGWEERVRSRAHPARIESLAVLPLENYSHDAEQDYFADGMTDELITELAKIHGLRVISRTSVMQYKGTKRPLPDIARELHVDAVVEGSVERSQDRVRITAQLIQAPTDTHLWADSYDRDLRDVIALQAEVARAIAQQVRAELTPAEQAQMASSRPVDPEGYELYLKGLFFWNKGTSKEAAASRQYFEQAIAKSPSYAPAYVGLAFAYNLMGDYVHAKASARHALELDDTLGSAHAALAFATYRSDWDFATAGREFRRAIELDPNDSRAHHTYALYLGNMGRNAEAIAEMRRALELDPLSPLTNNNLANFLIGAGQYQEASQKLGTALEIDPHYQSAFIGLGIIYELQGSYDQAAAEYRKGCGSGDPLKFCMAHLAAAQGRKQDALRLLQELITSHDRAEVGPYEFGELYAKLGDKDRAFEWLEKAYQEHAEDILLLKPDPDLKSLRDDPRYIALLRRVGLPP